MKAHLPMRLVWTLAAVAGLILLAVVALPYIASTRLAGDRIAAEMSEWSGLGVSIGAAPEIRIWPGLRVGLSDLTLSRPDGTTVATVERAEIDLSAMAALSGRIDFSTARFIRPTLIVDDGPLQGAAPHGRIGRGVETARAIVAENSIDPDTSRLPAEPFGVVEFMDGRIMQRPATPGGSETLIASELSGIINWATLNGRADTTANGLWRGEKTAVTASVANPLLLMGGGASPVRFTLKSTPANLSFDGTARVGANGYLDGRGSFSAPSTPKLFDWWGAPLARASAIGAITLESQVSGSMQRLRFENATLTLDGKPARGALDLILTGKLPMISGTLAFDTLDLDAFLSAFTPLDTSPEAGPATIDADFANRLSLDLRLSAAKATAGTLALSNVAATARIDEGLAAVDISDASAFGGSIQTGLRIDRKDEGARVEIRMLGTDIDGGELGAAFGLTQVTPMARGTVSVILKGEGESWEALLDHADGSISVSLGRGAISGIDLPALLARVREGQPFPVGEVAAGQTAIDGLEVKAAVSNGRAEIERGEIRMPLNRLSLSGTAPLDSGELNLLASADAPQQATAGTEEPATIASFAINGPWGNAHVTPIPDADADADAHGQ